MTRKKIAIFSGTIPSTTFIEQLIKGVAQHYEVLLFGVVNKVYRSSPSVKLYITPKNHVINACYTLYRGFRLFFSNYNAFKTILKEVKRYPTLYERFIWFSKFVPIALYKPDIIHFQWARDLDFYGFFISQLKFKSIVSLRGAHVNYTPITQPRIATLYRNTFPLVDGFHAVSKAIAKEAQGYGAPGSRIKLIHSPVPLDFFEACRSLNEKNNILKIVSIGRFHWIKGFKYILDALGILKSTGVKFEYTIVGPSKFTEAILFQIHDLDLKEEVKLRGHLDQTELLDCLLEHDLFLLGSLEEGIANVLLEAMAVGIPVVSTDCGGMPEVVKPNETGWLVPKRDPEAMAEAITRIASASTFELSRITLNAHEFVKKEFDEQKCFQKFNALYQEVINT